MANDLTIIERRLEKEIRIEDYHNNYSLQTAMQAVAVIFSENGGFPRCTIESKYKAILTMVTLGLNPLKGQCYLIPYGNQLQLQMDYSGAIMVAKREDKRIHSINSKVVRDGDVFDINTINGVYYFSHKPTLQSLNGEIIAAYAVAVDVDGNVIDSDVMTIEDIKNTWRNTNVRHKGEPVVRADGSIHPGSNHGKWPEKMTIKTVIKRLCTGIIKSSPNATVADLADDEIIITEAEPEIIDFDQAPDPQQPQEPEEPPCNPDQAKQICEMWKQIDPESNVVDNLSAHLNRQIKRLREVTQIEAAQYLNVLAARLEATKEKESEPPEEDDMPNWA